MQIDILLHLHDMAVPKRFDDIAMMKRSKSQPQLTMLLNVLLFFSDFVNGWKQHGEIITGFRDEKSVEIIT
jgi:hypothetical protein